MAGTMTRVFIGGWEVAGRAEATVVRRGLSGASLLLEYLPCIEVLSINLISNRLPVVYRVVGIQPRDVLPGNLAAGNTAC